MNYRGIIILFAMQLFVSGAQAADFGYQIVDLDKSAWVQRGSSARVSLKKGEILKTEDQLTVLPGNQITLQSIPDPSVRLSMKGWSSATLRSGVRQANIWLAQGRLFAETSGLVKGDTFEVRTPTAIAAVRGTQFQIQVNAQRTIVFNYEGTIEIHSLDAAGTVSEKSVLLQKGEKILLDGSTSTVPRPVEMTVEELTEGRDHFPSTPTGSPETQPSSSEETPENSDPKSDSLEVSSAVEFDNP